MNLIVPGDLDDIVKPHLNVSHKWAWKVIKVAFRDRIHRIPHDAGDFHPFPREHSTGTHAISDNVSTSLPDDVQYFMVTDSYYAPTNHQPGSFIIRHTFQT